MTATSLLAKSGKHKIISITLRGLICKAQYAIELMNLKGLKLSL